MNYRISYICCLSAVLFLYVVCSTEAKIEQQRHGLLRINRLSNNQEVPRVPKSWIVVMKNQSTSEQGMAAYFSLTDMGARVRHRYLQSVFGSEMIHFTIDDDSKVYDFAQGKNPLGEASWRSQIAWIQPDYKYRLSAIQTGSAPWGLDRLDQLDPSAPKLDGLYSYTTTGQGVNVYVLDTGVTTKNPQFQGRARTVFDAIQDGNEGDCNGHGTHVAGIVASAEYGVAKQASVYDVRVLDCEGSGTSSTLLAGFEYVLQNGRQPAIVQLSLGGQRDEALDNAAETLLQQGYVMVVAAGNENQDACNVSPASSQGVIAVGATDQQDVQASFSNYGDCVTIFAPGTNIKSLDYQDNNGFAIMSGTSMAAPFVSGVAALVLQDNSDATPAQVRDAILRNAEKDTLTLIDWPTPNLLVRSPFLDTQLLKVTPSRPLDLSSAYSVKTPSQIWWMSGICTMLSAIILQWLGLF